jgi:hypothetical protein
MSKARYGSAKYSGQDIKALVEAYNRLIDLLDTAGPVGASVADLGSTAETVGGAHADGSAITASRSDHKHEITNPKLDDLATPDDNTDLNANTSQHGLLVKATAPVTAYTMNIVGITQGQTNYSNKALFDTVNPEPLGTAGYGGSLLASHRDHVHQLPAIDAMAAATDITTRDATTSAHGLLLKATAPAAGLMNVVGLANGETVYANKPLFDTTNPANIGTAGPGSQVIAARRDHVHAIPDNHVTYAKMQDVSATDKVLGRSTAGSGDAEEIACTAAGRALLDDANAAAQLVTLGIGVMTAWTPTLTGITIGSGTVTARYNKVGTIVFYEFKLVFAADTSITGDCYFSLPANTKETHFLHGNILDYGTAYYHMVGLHIGSTVQLLVLNHTGTYLAGYVNLSATVPMTWAVNDQIVINGKYECA